MTSTSVREGQAVPVVWLRPALLVTDPVTAEPWRPAPHPSAARFARWQFPADVDLAVLERVLAGLRRL
jgi:hypothetical protein